MARILLFLLLLAFAVFPGRAAPSESPVRTVDLDADALRANPALLGSDTLALVVTCSRECLYKLSERDDVLAAGRFLPGSNSLRFSRPGLCAGSQSLFLILDLLGDGASSQKFLRFQVTIEGREGPGPQETEGTSGSFRLEMYHAGSLIGFRKKTMEELLDLKTGPVMAVSDPALSGSAIRSQPPSHPIPLLGMALALAKHLAKKRADKKVSAQAAEMRKKRLETALVRLGPGGVKREVPIVIELRTE
ncbi:MAG: hypothetical protein JXO51_05270 [Candidatus Aminicenantes bacterium]|nr:hypothetical protein [Candidatus Aminicenantes bacterium]